METLVTKSKGVNLTIPPDMYDSPLVKKLVGLIRFRELTNGIELSEEQIFKFTESIQENWWHENQEGFLKNATK